MAKKWLEGEILDNNELIMSGVSCVLCFVYLLILSVSIC